MSVKGFDEGARCPMTAVNINRQQFEELNRYNDIFHSSTLSEATYPVVIGNDFTKFFELDDAIRMIEKFKEDEKESHKERYDTYDRSTFDINAYRIKHPLNPALCYGMPNIRAIKYDFDGNTNNTLNYNIAEAKLRSLSKFTDEERREFANNIPYDTACSHRCSNSELYGLINDFIDYFIQNTKTRLADIVYAYSLYNYFREWVLRKNRVANMQADSTLSAAFESYCKQNPSKMQRGRTQIPGYPKRYYVLQPIFPFKFINEFCTSLVSIQILNSNDLISKFLTYAHDHNTAILPQLDLRPLEKNTFLQKLFDKAAAHRYCSQHIFKSDGLYTVGPNVSRPKYQVLSQSKTRAQARASGGILHMELGQSSSRRARTSLSQRAAQARSSRVQSAGADIQSVPLDVMRAKAAAAAESRQQAAAAAAGGFHGNGGGFSADDGGFHGNGGGFSAAGGGFPDGVFSADDGGDAAAYAAEKGLQDMPTDDEYDVMRNTLKEREEKIADCAAMQAEYAVRREGGEMQINDGDHSPALDEHTIDIVDLTVDAVLNVDNDDDDDDLLIIGSYRPLLPSIGASRSHRSRSSSPVGGRGSDQVSRSVRSLQHRDLLKRLNASQPVRDNAQRYNILTSPDAIQARFPDAYKAVNGDASKWGSFSSKASSRVKSEGKK